MRRRRLLFSFMVVGAFVLTTVPGAVAKHEGAGEPKGPKKAELFGSAQDDVDPQNTSNEVVSIDNTGAPAQFGGIRLKLGKKVQAPMLDNELETKYFFVGRSCGGGSPRAQLAISLDGDKSSEGNAFGHYGPPFAFTGCLMDQWVYEDLTDNLNRWDLSQFAAECAAIAGCVFPSPFVIPWDAVETFLAAFFPTHRILRASLVDDTFPGSPSGQGCAYYDLSSLGPQTVEDWKDTKGHKPDKGFTNNC